MASKKRTEPVSALSSAAGPDRWERLRRAFERLTETLFFDEGEGDEGEARVAELERYWARPAH